MKYTLIISGTKDEIQKAGEDCWRIERQQYAGSQKYIVNPEFRIVEPRYRYRTSEELWQDIIEPAIRLGQEMSFSGDRSWITIDKETVPKSMLGRNFDSTGCYTAKWKAVFLKEIT